MVPLILNLNFRSFCHVLFHFRCRHKFTTHLAGNADEIFVRLRSFETKNEQDVFLQSLIGRNEVKQHRPRKHDGTARASHEHAFTYIIMVGDHKQKVCLSAFTSLYGIEVSGIRRLRNLLVNGKSPMDLRGKKLRTNAISATIRLLMRQHVESFPVKESKYAGKTIKYLDARLIIKIIYQTFAENILI